RPMVLFAAELPRTIPALALASAALPVIVVPMRLFSIKEVVAPNTLIPLNALPEIRFPAAALAPPTVVPGEVESWMPALAFGMADVPLMSVPTLLLWIRLPAAALRTTMPALELPETKLPAPGNPTVLLPAPVAIWMPATLASAAVPAALVPTVLK